MLRRAVLEGTEKDKTGQHAGSTLRPSTMITDMRGGVLLRSYMLVG